MTPAGLVVPPLLTPGSITTLVGPPDAEMAALSAAIAVSHRTGVAILPGFVPGGPGEVMVYACAGEFITWKALMVDICTAARIAPQPHVSLHRPRESLLHPLPERDPDVAQFWHRTVEADVDAELSAAKAAGRELTPVLTVIFHVDRAAGRGDAAGMRQLYEKYAGSTVLMAGVESGEDIAASYGPVIELPDMHNSIGWRDLLAEVTGGDAPEEVDQSTEELDALFAGVGDDLDVAEAPDLAGDTPPSTGGLGILFGRCAVYGQWREVNSPSQGHYLERIAPGAFTNTLAQSAPSRVKCSFAHGRDPEFGCRSLGPVTVLREDRHGVWYEVDLVDAEHTRRLVPGLQAGLYRSSFTLRVIRDHLVKKPGRTAHNPGGLPELTILEVALAELGPCHNPAFFSTSAGIRT